jgi:hypothetical protein
MARSDAAPLIALSHRISHEGTCAQARDIPRLQHGTERLVNTHRVPAALAESLMSGVNALSAQAPVCLPPVPATTVVATPAPPPVPHRHGHADKPHHEKHKGKKHH